MSTYIYIYIYICHARSSIQPQDKLDLPFSEIPENVAPPHIQGNCFQLNKQVGTCLQGLFVSSKNAQNCKNDIKIIRINPPMPAGAFSSIKNAQHRQTKLCKIIKHNPRLWNCTQGDGEAQELHSKSLSAIATPPTP